MHTLKTLEHLQQSADGIVQQINTYKQSKDEIGNFISDYKNKENKFPTPAEVQKAYKALTKNVMIPPNFILQNLMNILKKV